MNDRLKYLLFSLVAVLALLILTSFFSSSTIGLRPMSQSCYGLIVPADKLKSFSKADYKIGNFRYYINESDKPYCLGADVSLEK